MECKNPVNPGGTPPHSDEASPGSGLQSKEERYRELIDIILRITPAVEICHLIEILLEGTAALFRSPISMLFLLDPDRPEISLLSTRGLSFDQIAEGPIQGRGFFRLLTQLSPIHLEGEAEHPDFKGLPIHTPSLHRVLLTPFTQGTLRGYIGVANLAEPYTEEDGEFLNTLSKQTAAVIQNARLHEEIQQLARTDSLTGLFHHREMQQRLEEEVERSRRYGHPFSILMIDIDRFKSFNDAFGHALGDQILRLVAHQIRKSVRSVDTPARYGGEEFMVILPETIGEGARRAAEKIRKAVYEQSIKTPNNKKVSISVSLGLASFPQDAQDRETLLNAADRALYLAKEEGRNRVCTANQTLEQGSLHAGKLARLLTDPRV